MATAARRKRGTTNTRRRGATTKQHKPKQQEPKAPPLINPDPQLVVKLEKLGAAVIPPDFATEVTPEMAEMMLRGNARNRHVKPNKVEEFAGALVRGEWRYNGDCVRITTAGKLLDGQHRLMAIVQTETAAPLLVAVIEEDEALKAQATMDVGAKRKFGDMLQIEGVTSATTVAAVTGLIWGFEQDRVPTVQNRSVRATIQQKYDVLERHPGIRESVSRVRHSPLLVGSLAAGLHYLFSTADEEDADEFFHLLKTGEGLETGHPILTLRERLIREESRATGQLHTRVRTAFVIIAWNAWRQGRSLAKLQFRPGGARPDRFPQIDGLDESMFRFANGVS
jgi:hypothetical protein